MNDTARDPSATDRWRIFVVDDDPVFRLGLIAVIRDLPHLDVWGEADNAEQALNALCANPPDLVIIDLGLPGRSALRLMEDLHALYPDVIILAMSRHADFLDAERVESSGGRVLVDKHLGPLQVIAGIREVIGEPAAVSRKVGHQLMKDFAAAGASANLESPRLTECEFAILQLIGQGEKSGEIARHLHLRTKTVSDHRIQIKRKFHLRNNTQLVHYAMRYMETVR